MITIKTTEYQLISRNKESFLEIHFNCESKEGMCSSNVTINVTYLSALLAKSSETVRGLFYFASLVYAIDRTFKREIHSVDGWSRLFYVEFKLPADAIFSINRNEIEKILSFLTGDYWKCSFEASDNITYQEKEIPSDYNEISQVNLFSGGLDSLIGAIDFMSKNNKGKVFLASHYDSSMPGPKADQTGLLNVLHGEYSQKYITFPHRHSAVLITPKDGRDTTCRSRSLLFISLALVVAEYTHTNIIIPENGSVSLNYPLSASRRGSCSTRTTHPVVIHGINRMLKHMDLSSQIYNPYEFMTKGEMVRGCYNRDLLLNIVKKSNSCGKRGRKQLFYDDNTATHCGRCMPCMYRKASLTGFNDDTRYGIKLDTLFNLKNRTISDDFYAMLNFLRKNLSEAEIREELSIAGMSNMPQFDLYVDLVKRTRNELKEMLKSANNNSINEYLGLC